MKKINVGLPVTEKISQLNDQIIEVDGKISQALFEKNEIATIISDIGINKKFLIDVALGNTEATYTGWTHILAENGYSIWKYSPVNYVYNILNELYLNNKLIENRGLAASEAVASFDSVFLYSNSTYIDDTTEAGTPTGTEFDLVGQIADYLYVGSANMFHGIKFELNTKGSENNLVVEYWTGASWVEITESGFELVDNTLNFTADGAINWNDAVDTNWVKNTVNGSNKYWIRISTSTVPVVVAQAYYIIPDTSVVGLLALSSEQVINEEWAWCSYGGELYVTIRNAGNRYTEGSYYISSSSSVNNKKNFFVYNNKYTINHEDSDYVSVSKLNAPDEAPADANLEVGQITFWLDETSGSQKLIVKAKLSDGSVKSGEVVLS